MSDSSINDLDQDSVVINTKVTIGKSFKSRGWALSRTDICDWIPAEKYERDCKIIINDICSDAILRFNPRLFYESDELSDYLKELYDKGCSKNKIPMKIKVNKKEFYSNVISRDFSPKNFDTMLRVGKSYSSKGWQLSKDVVSLLFPLDVYEGIYSIYINDIHSYANLNAQFRLFYKSDDLSQYLEELYYKDASAKIPAKVLFEYDSNPDDEFLGKDIVLSKSLDESRGSHYCTFCGNLYDVDDNHLDIESRFENLCPLCVEKIIALDAYNIIKDSSLSSFIKKDFVKDKFTSNFDEIWDLLIEYNFLSKIGDLYKLNENEDIENNYSKFILDNGNVPKSKSKRRNRSKILELIDNEEEDGEDICIICGSILKGSEVEKCAVCLDKSLATEYLRNIVTKVPYEKNFSKNNLLDIGIENIEVDLLIDKLLEYGLIIKSDIYFKLNDVAALNGFISKYADSPYELQINYINDNSDILKVSKKDLSSEDKIDSLINWRNYWDYVSFKKGQYGYLLVYFKQEGNFLYSKKYNSSYEAKIEAINYLKAIGKLELIDDNFIKLEFK